MKKIDMTLLLKSFTLCALLLGSMISQVFCEKVNDTNSIVAAAVPKSKEITFTPTHLADAINGLNLKYAQTNTAIATSLCEGITGDYAPKIEKGNLKFYLWKNFKQDFLNSISGQTYQGLKDILHFPKKIFNASLSQSIWKTVSIDALESFLGGFQFLEKKLVPKSTEASSFKFDKESFTKYLLIRVSENELKKFCATASNCARNDKDDKAIAKNQFLSSLLSSINNNNENVVILYERFCEIVDGEASFKQTNYWGWRSTYKIDVASSDASKKELLNGIKKFFISFIDTDNNLAKEFFSYLSYYQGNSSDAVTNLSNVFDFIFKFRQQDMKSPQEAMNAMFSQRSVPTMNFNGKCKDMKVERVLKIDANDIINDCKLQTFEHSEVSEEKILKAYLNALQDQKEFENLTGSSPSEVVKTLLANLQNVTSEQLKTSLNAQFPPSTVSSTNTLTNADANANANTKSVKSTLPTVDPSEKPSKEKSNTKWIIIIICGASFIIFLIIGGLLWNRKQEDKV